MKLYVKSLGFVQILYRLVSGSFWMVAKRKPAEAGYVVVLVGGESFHSSLYLVLFR